MVGFAKKGDEQLYGSIEIFRDNGLIESNFKA